MLGNVSNKSNLHSEEN